ncbi:hypothetical protein [Rubidibacter lacunae]|uniref:hypothetical protein n=1 Tax=Rubidibacter lacunae TaxID=582514 RepID=UPI0012EB5A3C|nr:hypothetical protein [Rubidibacter lacunae]
MTIASAIDNDLGVDGDDADDFIMEIRAAVWDRPLRDALGRDFGLEYFRPAVLLLPLLLLGHMIHRLGLISVSPLLPTTKALRVSTLEAVQLSYLAA